MIFKKKNLFKLSKIIFSLIIILLLMIGIEYFLGTLGLRAFYKDINSISTVDVLLIFVFGLIAFSPMPLYQQLLNKKFHLQDISLFKIFYYSYMPATALYNIYKTRKKTTNTKHNLIIILGNYLINLILSSIFFIIILGIFGIHISIIQILIIYLFSRIIGFISFLPAGIGVFDLVILISLSNFGVPKDFALISVIVYRLSYYVVPLLITTIIFITNTWSTLNLKYNSLPKILLGKVSFTALKILVFLSGAALLLSTALPQVFFKIKEIYFLSSATELHYSRNLVVIVGFLLIVMSKSIKYRSKSIFITTLLFLIVGSFIIIAKSFNYIAAGYLLIVAIILFLSKREFHRKGFVVSLEDIITTSLLLLFFWIIYIVVGYPNIPFKDLTVRTDFMASMHHYRTIFQIGTAAFLISILFFCAMYLLGKHTNRIPLTTVSERLDDIKDFLKTHNGTSLTHLIYLNDKYVFFSKDKKGMIQYSISLNKLIVLGNPLGDRDNLNNLIEEFFDFATLYGYVPVFFEVSSSMLDILHDYGYEFMKLGEAAIVHLDEFTLSGQKMQKVRTCCNKINKAGYSFEVINGNIDTELMKELKEISDTWLNGKKEMGFSMGFFDEDYIKRAPIGLVRDENNKLKAFVTTMPTYGDNETFCSDLMRYSRETPRGVMDYMFANLLMWGKENGYKYFNFGVSPLANVGFSKYSFLTERFASQIYYHGKIFYSFEGLKNFKGKYAHSWEPKLLAHRNRFSLPVTMLQTNLVVSNPKQKFNND
ncbi:MAG: bifunctional lysylphosphatidylglycerol flippase/synthetase MprF [Sarcina sp.]